MLTCSFAMYPNTENTTNPDKKLVKIFKHTIATVSLQIKYTNYKLNKNTKKNIIMLQSCKSGWAFRVSFGPKVDKNFEPKSGLSRAFCFRFTKI